MDEGNDFGWIRSALFVPGNRPDRVDKAIHTAADAVIIDLEDAVPLSQKQETRSLVRKKISTHFQSKKIIVRVNALATEFAEDDFRETISEGLSGIMVPKVESPSDIKEIDALILEAESRNGLAPGKIFILPLIESARAVENAFAIASEKASTDRMFSLAFGAADFALDMGIAITRSGEELIYPRGRISVACRAAGLPPPIDTPFMIDLKDRKALENDIARAVQFGFQGKLCIHPNQVDVCNEFFSPSAEEVVQARKIIKAFEEAENKGLAAIQLEGKFIDYPVVERSRRIVKLSKAKQV